MIYVQEASILCSQMDNGMSNEHKHILPISCSELEFNFSSQACCILWPDFKQSIQQAVYWIRIRSVFIPFPQIYFQRQRRIMMKIKVYKKKSFSNGMTRSRSQGDNYEGRKVDTKAETLKKANYFNISCACFSHILSLSFCRISDCVACECPSLFLHRRKTDSILIFYSF